MNHIKAALIGCGMIADTHFTALQNAGAEIVGVFDQNRERATLFASAHGIHTYDSMDALLSDDITLVSVCTPSGTHAAMAETVMKHGKYPIVEKPMALTVSECRHILEIEKKTGRFCAPISQLRFSDAYRQVKKAIGNGDFGRMVLSTLSMKYYRSPEYYAGSWRGTQRMDGGGALMNQGIHGIDVMCGLLGYPILVHGRTATLVHGIEVEDTAVANLVFPDGTLGVIDAGTAVTYAKPRRLELCGTQASVTLTEDIIQEAEGISFSPQISCTHQSFKNPTAIGTGLHEAQFRNILAAVSGEEPLYYTSADAMQTVAVIRAIYQSAKTGTAVTFPSSV